MYFARSFRWCGGKHNIFLVDVKTTCIDGWMTCDFTSFLTVIVISGRCIDDNERLCAMELRLRLRRFHLE